MWHRFINAVQVYSVREDAEKDFAGTMKKIKEIGYDGVELAGLYGLTPQEVKAAIEDAGLVALSAHVPFQDLVADMEGTIQQYVEIGVKYIAIPYLMEEDRPGTPKFEGNVKLFEEIGRPCITTTTLSLRKCPTAATPWITFTTPSPRTCCKPSWTPAG